MNFSQEDFQKARRISHAIQHYLTQNKMVNARSTDLYEMLARKGLVERDRHEGIHFRNFLRKLKDANLLHLIPQCTFIQNSKGVEWYFNPATNNQDNISNSLKKAAIVHKPAMKQEDIGLLIEKERPNVDALPVNDNVCYTSQQLEIRKFFPRAYELWTPQEYEILNRVYQQCKNVDAVAKLLQRQPHIVSDKLKLIQH